MRKGEGEAIGPLPAWAKKAIGITGLLWALLGLPALLGWLCTSILTRQGDPQAVQEGVAGLTLLAVTGGAGAAVAWHAWRSLVGKASASQRLPPAWLWACLFALCVVAGSVILGTKFAPGLFFPPLLLAAAAAPPLLALSWFTGGAAEGLTWRRGLSALAGGATVGVLVALALEILLPVIVLALVAGLADVALPGMRALLDSLAGKEVATAVASPGFVFVFVEIAVIAPLVEEFAKPLVTLPLLGRLARRDAFLVAAMAGAGFAALENVIYTGFGLPFWVGILVVRALGGAIHPLGAGLVGLGWRDVLCGEARAGLKLASRFGVAVGMHALWNGGSLLVITLAGARFFGELPPEIDILGISAAGTTLALLVVLGLLALWLGRFVLQHTEVPVEPSGPQFALSDRAVAIWALACLTAIVPAGIAGLQLLMH
jgi:RsiW-degrading membrane proteinase PrsW (M82 family)